MADSLPLPDYARVGWLFGLRLRAPDAISPDRVAALAERMTAGARSRGLLLPKMHGAYGAPFLPEGEVLVGAILNGAPIVRERAEMREGVLAKHHAAVQARLEHRARVHSSLDEDLDVEESWIRHLGELAEEVRAELEPSLERVPLQDDIGAELHQEPLGGCAWYLAARRPGGAGALVFGTLLPSPGAPYGDDVLETIECQDGDGQGQARLVGRPLLRVDPQSPVACLPGPLAHGGWRGEVTKRITAQTGKVRAMNLYLVATA